MINHLVAGPDSLFADGRSGAEEMEVEHPVVTFGTQVGLTFDLKPVTGGSSALIRTDNLVDFTPGVFDVALVGEPAGTPDVTFAFIDEISSGPPGIDQNFLFTWFDATVPGALTISGTGAGTRSSAPRNSLALPAPEADDEAAADERVVIVAPAGVTRDQVVVTGTS